MMRLTLLCMTLFMSIPSTSAFGAEWSVGWNGAGGRFQQLTLTDKDLQFYMDRFLCKASKVTLDNINDDVFERRTVACHISEDTYVSTYLAYNLKGKTCMDTQSLTIYDKDKVYIASLFVKCK